MERGIRVLILGTEAEGRFISEAFSRYLKKNSELRDNMDSVFHDVDPEGLDFKKFDIVLVGETMTDHIPMDILKNSHIIVVGSNIPAKYTGNVQYILVNYDDDLGSKKAATEMDRFLKRAS